MTNIPQVLYYYRYHPFSLSHNFQLNFKTYYSFAFARELYRQRLSVGSDWIESNDVKAVEDYFHKAVNSEPQWESNYIRDVAKKAILAKEFQRAYLLVLQTFKDRPFSKANLSIFMVFVGTRLSPVHPLRIKRRLLMKNGGFSSNPRLNNFVSLFSGLVTSQVLNFFLYVILARLFTEEQFGAFSLFTSYVILVSVISNPQIPILALSSKNLDQLESIEKWSESNLIASFFVMIPFFLFFFFLNKSILGGYLLLIPFAVFLYTLTENRKIFYNQREDFRKSNVLTLVPRTSGNLLKIFLSGMSGVANGLIIGEVLGNTFTLFVRLPRLWHRLPNLLNEFKNHKSFLIYNYPSTLAGIATMELVPFFIISLFSVEVAGAYFLFDKFVLQPFVLTGSAIGSSQARYISSLNAESKKLFFAKVFSLLFFISVLAVLFLRNFGDEIIFFLAKKTLFADNVLQILMFFVPLKLLKGVIYIFHHASSNWRWGFVTRILQVSLLSGLFIYGKLNEISIENFVMGLLIIELIGELLIIISSLKSNISSNADSRCSNG